MAHYTSHTTSDTGDQAFDLSHIFIGREQQLDLFKIYLDRWQQHMSAAAPDDSIVTTAPSPNNKIQGLIVLLYGRGGFGKSTLLRRYREIVLAENQNLLPGQSRVTVSPIVDWEFAIEGKRGLFNPPPGQEIDAAAYFQALCGQLAISLDKNPKDFKEYQSAVRDTEKARKDASGILDSMQKDDRYAWLRGLTVEAIRGAIRTSIPGSGVVVDNPSIKSAIDEAAKLTQEHISRIHDRLRDRLGNTLGDYLDSALRLGLALGHDLHDFAKNFPLLIFFDTYEEVDEGDRLLRTVIGAAGLRVGWVLAGRDNLWAGPGQPERSIAVEYGYKEIVPADRGLAIDFNAGGVGASLDGKRIGQLTRLAIDFNAGGVGAFTLSDIKDYFDLLWKQVGHHLQLAQVKKEGAQRILDVTGGVPLAVKIAAGLYMDTAKLDTVTETVEGKRAIVDQMVRRYLLHARDNQDERARLYGLAMLRRADQPLAVAAALGLSAEEAATSYASALHRLHRRYSFIFTEREEPTLHQKVRHFLRLWLLEHRKDPEIAAVNERLKVAHEDALKKLEERMQYVNLQERLQDEEWTSIYLDLAEQQFWLDPVEGVRSMLPFMIAAAIYRRDINKDAANVGTFFEMHMPSSYRTWWTWVAHSLVYTTSRNPSAEALTGLEELAKLASQRCPTFLPPLPDYRSELEAALWWRLGEAYLRKDDAKALTWYEKALVALHNDSELKDITARTYWVANNAEKKKSTERIFFLNRAVELKPNYVAAYYSRGIIFSHQKKYQEAITDFERAIELDPKSAWIYVQRGITYRHQKKYQEAITDFECAIELDPKSAWAYLQRGITYGHDLDEHQRAMTDFDRAIELDPKFDRAYVLRGRAYRWRKEYQRAIADFDSAIALNPNYAWAYGSRSQVYTHLGKYQEAIAGFDHAIALEPSLAGTYKLRGDAYLWMRNTINATADYRHCYELDPTRDDAAWMLEWASMSKHRPGIETAERLEVIAAIDRKRYTTYILNVCLAVALGLRDNLKDGLAKLEQALMLESEIADCYFWKGMLCAYYYRGGSRLEKAKAMIEQALSLGLPPVLLTPLYWLEKDHPDFFEKYARPLLGRYGV